jgi:hypothetical protein
VGPLGLLPTRIPRKRRPSGIGNDDEPGHSSRTFSTRDPSPARPGRRDGRAGDGRTLHRDTPAQVSGSGDCRHSSNELAV